MDTTKYSRYTREQLYDYSKQKTYSGKNLNEIVFPLGGIGTGSVGLTGRGGFSDWEIFNRPNFNGKFERTFPAIWVKEKGQKAQCKILEAPVPPPYTASGHGNLFKSGEGFPHMDDAEFTGEFPFAKINFKSKNLPVKIELEAFNPFIPSDADNSGYPVAILNYKITNHTSNPVKATVMWSIMNSIGSIGEASKIRKGHFNQDIVVENGVGNNVNQIVEEQTKNGKIHGVDMFSFKWKEDHPRFGTMALMTPNQDTTIMRCWSRDAWFTPFHQFWDHFSETGELPTNEYGASSDQKSDAAALGIKLDLLPKESKIATFYISWHFPIFEKYWDPIKIPGLEKPKYEKWNNYYSTQFENAVDICVKLHENYEYLYSNTKKFHDALFASTIPRYVLDAVSSQIAILNTATVIRLKDGTFYGFEGSSPVEGCCEGSCTHVWNYQQALAFLFPSLERSMHTVNYKYNFFFDDIGALRFRIALPLGSEQGFNRPCADGQFGGIMHVYREWKISGNDEWLKEIWPKVKLALEFAWEDWDEEKTGVLREWQHNTYDIDFLGPNSMLTSFYLGALKAGSEMAKYLGEESAAKEYDEIRLKGTQWIDDNLFNGEYYIQKYDASIATQYQYGKGCLSDQVLGQQIARIAGLGYVMNPEKTKKTLQSIFKYNWISSLKDHANAQRTYAINDEPGLLLCTWPRGERPAIPFVYSDEVWTGIEYQVAVHCIMEGMVDEGLTITKGVRERFDGYIRNPWDEYECGHHYARAMASYGLLNALSGFEFDMVNHHIGFTPAINQDNFQTFWALDNVWGTYSQTNDTVSLKILYGKIIINSIKPGIELLDKKPVITCSGTNLEYTVSNKNLIQLKTSLILGESEVIEISF
jgi:uncharacterized protein (DUF608 family)